MPSPPINPGLSICDFTMWPSTEEAPPVMYYDGVPQVSLLLLLSISPEQGAVISPGDAPPTTGDPLISSHTTWTGRPANTLRTSECTDGEHRPEYTNLPDVSRAAKHKPQWKLAVCLMI